MLYFLASIIIWHVENTKNQSIMDSIHNDNIVSPVLPQNQQLLDLEEESGDYSIESGEILEQSNIEEPVISLEDQIKEYSQKSDIQNESNAPTYIINFEALQNINPDTIGWVKVANTNIDYPIVKSSDNDFYLTHNFLKEKNSAGWVFADYRMDFHNPCKNFVIYGHNRRNNSMFGSLDKILHSSWYEKNENKYLFFATLDNNYIAEIFSIYKIKADELSIPIEFKNVDEFSNYINTLNNKSIYNFNTSVSSTDNIVTLYTCDDDNSYRILLHAKLIEI